MFIATKALQLLGRAFLRDNRHKCMPWKSVNISEALQTITKLSRAVAQYYSWSTGINEWHNIESADFGNFPQDELSLSLET